MLGNRDVRISRAERKKENEQGQNILSQESFFLIRNLVSLRLNFYFPKTFT